MNRTLLTGMPWISSASHSDVSLFAQRQRERMLAAQAPQPSKVRTITKRELEVREATTRG